VLLLPGVSCGRASGWDCCKLDRVQRDGREVPDVKEKCVGAPPRPSMGGAEEAVVMMPKELAGTAEQA